MIFFGGGSGCGFLLFGFALLVLLGTGDPSLLLVVLVFAVPFLLLRSFFRGAGRGGRRLAGGPVPWTPQPARSAGGADGWQAPQEPVLPRVSAADVGSLRDRLGHDVSTLQPGDDPVARQALADAAERYATAGTLLERATTDAQLRTAWLAAVEGLHASRVVRRQQGLDLGSPVPALPGSGPQLARPTRVDVQGRSYTGAPTYEPGCPHWFPGGSYGGRHVPGGWYDVPFWPSALVLGGLGGWALGGLMAGAVYGDDLAYGGDLDPGFDGGSVDDGGGFDDGGGGGDWGRGGDWGGGGGDWGGGGDFGGFGGGGDWGGGDMGGGDGGW